MDLNDLRSIVTVMGFVCFLAICVWAYSNHAKRGFEEAAMLPFSDDDAPAGATGGLAKQGKANG